MCTLKAKPTEDIARDAEAKDPDYKYNVWVGCKSFPEFSYVEPHPDDVCTDGKREGSVCEIFRGHFQVCKCTRRYWMNMAIPTCVWEDEVKSTTEIQSITTTTEMTTADTSTTTSKSSIYVSNDPKILETFHHPTCGQLHGIQNGYLACKTHIQ